jgi:hypothetical protein
MSYHTIVEQLKKLLTDLEQFLIIFPNNIEEIYIQLMPITEEKLYCEAVSNQFLHKKYQLNSKKISQLQQLGFHKSDEDCNYVLEYDVKDESAFEDLAKLILKIFVEIYGIIINDLSFVLDS